MSLIDQLRDVGAALPPSHVPGLAEALPILGALIAAAEHDADELLDAVQEDVAALERGESPVALNNILAPPEEQPAEVPAAAPVASAPVGGGSPAPVPEPATAPVQVPSDQAELAQVRAERDELAQQVHTLLANQQRTEARVDPVPPAEPSEPVPPAPASSDQGPVS